MEEKMDVEKFTLLCYLQQAHFLNIAEGVRTMRRTVLPAVLLFLALTHGCGGGGSSEPVNSIKIESIAPATDGAGFTAMISYDLQTADSAVIIHCYRPYFSDRVGDSWMGCPVSIADSADGTGITGITVNRGKGTATIIDAEAVSAAGNMRVLLVPDPNSTVGVVSDEQMVP